MHLSYSLDTAHRHGAVEGPTFQLQEHSCRRALLCFDNKMSQQVRKEMAAKTMLILSWAPEVQGLEWPQQIEWHMVMAYGTF